MFSGFIIFSSFLIGCVVGFILFNTGFQLEWTLGWFITFSYILISGLCDKKDKLPIVGILFMGAGGGLLWPGIVPIFILYQIDKWRGVEW
jgi:hypothetical protein